MKYGTVFTPWNCYILSKETSQSQIIIYFSNEQVTSVVNDLEEVEVSASNYPYYYLNINMLHVHISFQVPIWLHTDKIYGQTDWPKCKT